VSYQVGARSVRDRAPVRGPAKVDELAARRSTSWRLEIAVAAKVAHQVGELTPALAAAPVIAAAREIAELALRSPRRRWRP
jgi:hypothetical protein